MNKCLLFSSLFVVVFAVSFANAQFFIQDNCIFCDNSIAGDSKDCWITSTVKEPSATAARIYHWENVIANSTYEANSVCFTPKFRPEAYYNLILNGSELDYGNANLTLYFNSINVTANAKLFSSTKLCGGQKGYIHLKANDFIAIDGGALTKADDYLKNPVGAPFTGVLNLCGDVILEAPTIYVDGVAYASGFLKIQNPGAVTATGNSVLLAGKGIQATGSGGSESHFDGFMAGGLGGDTSWCCLLDKDCTTEKSGLAIDLPNQKIFLGGFAATQQCDARLVGQTVSLLPSSASPAKSFFPDSSFNKDLPRQLNVSNGRLFVVAKDFEAEEKVSSGYTQAFNLTGTFRLSANASLTSLKHIIQISTSGTGDSEILGTISANNQRPDLPYPLDQLGLNSNNKGISFNGAVLLNFFNGGLTLNNTVYTARGRLDNELYFTAPNAAFEAAKGDLTKWRYNKPISHLNLGCVYECCKGYGACFPQPGCTPSCIFTGLNYYYETNNPTCDPSKSAFTCSGGKKPAKRGTPAFIDFSNNTPAWHLDSGVLSYDSMQFYADTGLAASTKPPVADVFSNTGMQQLSDQLARYANSGTGYSFGLKGNQGVATTYNGLYSGQVAVEAYDDPVSVIANVFVKNDSWFTTYSLFGTNQDVWKEFCKGTVFNQSNPLSWESIKMQFDFSGDASGSYKPIVLSVNAEGVAAQAPVCTATVAWINGTEGDTGDTFNAALGGKYAYTFSIDYNGIGAVTTAKRDFVAGATVRPIGTILLDNVTFKDFDFSSKVEQKANSGGDFGANTGFLVFRYNNKTNGGLYMVTASGGDYMLQLTSIMAQLSGTSKPKGGGYNNLFNEIINYSLAQFTDPALIQQFKTWGIYDLFHYPDSHVSWYNVSLWKCAMPTPTVNELYFNGAKDSDVKFLPALLAASVCKGLPTLLATNYAAVLKNDTGSLSGELNPYYLRVVANGKNISVYLAGNPQGYSVAPQISFEDPNYIDSGLVGFGSYYSNTEFSDFKLLEKTNEKGSGDVIIASKNLLMDSGTDVRADFNANPNQNKATGGKVFIFGRDMTMQTNGAAGCDAFNPGADICTNFQNPNVKGCKPYVYTNPCNPTAFFFRLGCGLTQTFDDNNTNYYSRAPTVYKEEFCLTGTGLTLFGVVKDAEGKNALTSGSVMVESIKDSAGTPVYLSYLDPSKTPWNAKFPGEIVGGNVIVGLGMGGAGNSLLYLLPAATYDVAVWVSSDASDAFDLSKSSPAKRHKYIVQMQT